MAAYYPSLKNIQDSSYSIGEKVATLQSSNSNENMIYLNQLSNVHSQWLSANSFSGHDYVENRDEMSLISLNEDPQIFSQKTFDVRDEGHQIQGLSLSLGTEIPSSEHMSSFQNHYTNSGLDPWIGNFQNGETKHAKYLSFDLAAKIHDTENPQFPMNLTEVNPGSHWRDISNIPGNFSDRKYLKAAQDLLVELVNVGGSVKQSYKHLEDVPGETDMKFKTSSDLAPGERQDLLNKMTKLWSMLEDVDTRYRKYHQQMQNLVTSFEMMSGYGAAKPYTELALQTISRQFRRLRDTIKKQIQVTQQFLGEQGETENTRGVLPRLRFIDQKLRQRRSMPFGIVRQPWRPQKGLPETAVSVLRAWLFEHFLDPYPKDSEKVMLAKQTGLTRSQVANWFINARVRLWKPMVEEMYKEEFGNNEETSQHSREVPTEISASVSGDYNFEQSKKFKSNNQEVSKSERGIVRSQGGVDLDGNNLATLDSYDVSMLSYTMDDRVSLELGLQQFEKEYQPISSGPQLKHDDTDLSKVEYYSMEPLNQQERFSNLHLLSDFIV